MKKIQTTLVVILLLTGLIRVNAQTSAEIEKANKSFKPIFLVVYNKDGAEADKALAIANEAKKSLKSTSVVIKMNTADAANNALVTKYRMAGVPLPAILVIDKNGTAAGGAILKDATAQKLVDLVPTPKTSEMIKSLDEGKAVYVVFYKESMNATKKIMDNCAVACAKMDNKSVVMKIDLEDKNEAKLFQRMKCDLNAKEPVTYIINSTGDITGTFKGLTDVNTLVGTAKKTAAKSCCPGGAPAGGCK